MKNETIHFDNHSNNKLWLIIMGLSLIFIIIGIFGFFYDENNKWNSAIIALGNTTQAVFYSKYLWYKNAVQYNKRGMVIKIKSFWGKSLNYHQLKDIELSDSEFIISRYEMDDLVFNISNIQKKDIVKLYNILKNIIDNKNPSLA
ncbi:hypothetical protein SAMN04489761_3243 [Tenacibaculum sp. MAR_2009_124]|uniref:hypothetical protein n=1 Tax=Tenacibaculum sp. MAR_2009_124 TaxID=1250059 RepID=UPI0008948D6D|nr:hypothetical protein [Tenacibaculum sp. MAR_2009_124]SEC53051.1 hypothetical protein SAMN04489761_3243 [Tenacibaculum sp. MAR_2009_124]